jgi:hypothetical protein
VSDVKLLARWTGWCDPCEIERPLILTEAGERGLRAWLRGVGAEDRELTLTCGVCGEWQSVSHDEDDDTAPVVAASPILAVHPIGARQVLVHQGAPAAPYPLALVPAPRVAHYVPAASLDFLPGELVLVAAV